MVPTNQIGGSGWYDTVVGKASNCAQVILLVIKITPTWLRCLAYIISSDYTQHPLHIQSPENGS